VQTGEVVSLELATTSSMAGTVLLPDGSPANHFSLRVQNIETGFRLSDRFFRTNGTWSMDGLPGGPYRIQVDAPDASAEVTVELAPGEDRTGVLIRLLGKSQVRGRLVALADGAPLVGFSVSITRYSPGAANAAIVVASDGGENTTDSDGWFTVTSAPTGVVQISVLPATDALNRYAPFRTFATLPQQRLTTLPPIPVAAKPTRRDVGDLGFTTTNPSPQTDPSQRQWQVSKVAKDGPAAAAGLIAADAIAMVDGYDVTGMQAHLYAALTRVEPGTTVSLGLADGRTLHVTAR
jgi:hypothetical protein